MAWNESIPAGNRSIRLGDDDIREFKQDVRLGLTNEGIFPGPDVTDPCFWWTPPMGDTASRPAVNPALNGRIYINSQLATLQRQSTVAWEDIATLIPPGTKAAFYQILAPTGWTQLTDAALDDSAIRITTGPYGGSTGGNVGFSTAHTHTISSDGNHSHGGQTAQGNQPAAHDAGNNFGGQQGTHVHAISADGNHSHSGATGGISFKYANFALCVKS